MLRTLSAALVAAAVTAGSAAAQDASDRFALGVQVGTPGLGVEAQFQASPMLTLRAGADIFSYESDYAGDRLNYEGKAEFTTGSVMADLHPFSNSFLLSAGGYFGKRMVEVAAIPSGNETIGGVVITPQEFGALIGEADFGDAAPFVGIGFNNTFRTSGPIGFKAVVGATFGEDPQVTLRREGGIALPAPVQAAFDAEREEEERSLERDLEDFKILPVLQIGLAYRF